MSLKVIEGRLSGKRIADVLSLYTVNIVNEAELQSAIEAIFRAENIPFEREVQLSPNDRIDFMVGKVGIEIKAAFGYSDVVRQLHRYAQNDRVAEIVLITIKAQHQMPEKLSGKKVTVINLGWNSNL